MDPAIQRLLNDRMYDKRKYGALELEKAVREAMADNNHEKIKKIIDQLCHEFAYAVHQPHARNGGLIGLAAASIALGPDVARYLEEIVPPVLACFTDQDARVRYYACEAMYNIAKVAKGEILLYFNEVFDALCRLAADSELSVKNGAELLDRLVKDIVAVSATTYVSVLQQPETAVNGEAAEDTEVEGSEYQTAFSLARFIPLLTERMHVINPFTRNFLTTWIGLLDSVPDLELVSYLPAFLGGLFKFLSDPNRDVQVATQGLLERFLNEIKRIARVKQGIEESRKSRSDDKFRAPASSSGESAIAAEEEKDEPAGSTDAETDSITARDGNDGNEGNVDGDWVPGQDVMVDHSKILEILVNFLGSTSEEEIQLASLRWITAFFEICPEDILPFVPRLLEQVLPAMSSEVDMVCHAANRVNKALIAYIISLAEEPKAKDLSPPLPSRIPTSASKELTQPDRRDSTPSGRSTNSLAPRDTERRAQGSKSPDSDVKPTADEQVPDTPSPAPELDYAAAVNSLTLHFLNEHEQTRVAALSWLIMLNEKAPRKVLAINDGTFPALLKTLSDPADAVVTKDLHLLSQISRSSDDEYFHSFMVNLLQLFGTDRRLLETRGNLIIRQLCNNLSAERIYRTLADCLEKDEDVEFASIMVQNLNNNLITAPELADLRKRLKNLETRDGQTFFVALFKSWCHNSVATFSLCLLAQAYEQAYNLLQIFAELEMTVAMLIQIDKLVQLLESPVFTYLRLQLLEPERYPHLYKCLYGLLMLLPQSSAFAALKNRLNSVSAIGYLHIAPRPNPSPAPSTYDRPNRLKGRDAESLIRWTELLDKFRAVQEKARRHQQRIETGGVTGGTGTFSLAVPDANAVHHSHGGGGGAGLTLHQNHHSGGIGAGGQASFGAGGGGRGLGNGVGPPQEGGLRAGGTGTTGVGESASGATSRANQLAQRGGGAGSGTPAREDSPSGSVATANNATHSKKSSFGRLGGAMADARRRVKR